jgi:hypothetical protein
MKSAILIAIAFASLLGAQNVTVVIPNLTVPNEAAATYESWRLTQTNGPATPISLTSTITNSATTFALTGDLTQLAATNQITIDAEAMTIVSIAGQNVTVATRAAETIGSTTVSAPATHTAGAPVALLKWASAAQGFKQLIAGNVQQIVASYCPTHPSVCPTLTAQYTALQTANSAIAAIMALVVQ